MDRKSLEPLLHSLRTHLYEKQRSSNRIYMPAVNVRVFAQQGKVQFPLIRIIDMSTHGLGVELEMKQPLAVGEILQLEFLSPGSLKGLKCECTVRNCAAVISRHIYGENNIYRIGCEFLMPDNKIKAQLTKWSSSELTQLLDRRGASIKSVFMHFFMQQFSDKKFHPARSLKHLKQAFHLVYQEYRSRGYVSENQYGLHYHYHALLPHAWTFVATDRRGQVRGTLSLVPDRPGMGVSLDHFFADEVQKLRDEKRRFGEATLLALDKELFPRGSLSLSNFSKMKFLFQLYRVLFIHAQQVLGLDDLLILVHPKHTALYKQLYFSNCSQVVEHPTLKNAPCVLMRLNLRDVIPTIIESGENEQLYHFFYPKKVSLDQIGLKYNLQLSEIEEFLEMNEATKCLEKTEISSLRSMYRFIDDMGPSQKKS